MSKEDIAYCGLYCGTCGMGKGLISDRAKKLKEVVEAYKFEEYVSDYFNETNAQLVLDQAIRAMGYSEEDVAELMAERERSKFDFAQFKAGLEWLTKLGCPGCRESGNPTCPIRMCAISKKVRGCWECEEVEECHTLNTLEMRFSYNILENLRDIGKSGEEAHAKKMEKKRAAGFDNILDRKPVESEKGAGKKDSKKK